MSSIGIVILAAGAGTRLKMNLPKPLAPVGSLKLIDFPISASYEFLLKSGLNGEITAVTGHERELVENYVSNHYSNIKFAFQKQQLGTADAVRTYFSENKNASNSEWTLILCADTPLIQDQDLLALFHFAREKSLDGTAASFEQKNPFGYGRILRKKNGFKIIEEKEASLDEKQITEVNSGVCLFKTSYLVEELKKIDSNNNSGEFYLTDLFKENENVSPCLFQKAETFLGVNTTTQLEISIQALSNRKTSSLKESGVLFTNSKSVYIEKFVEVESGVIIEDGCRLIGKTFIETGSKIEQGSIIKNSKVGKDVLIKPYSHIDSSYIGEGAEIGPFANLRPASNIGVGAKVGNFVEIKKSNIKDGAKVSHLSYVGDSEIGEKTNIGCGFISSNYDGANKHKTKIGKDCFIGSGTQVIAPIKIGDNCFIGGGSTINKNMPDGAFAIARAKQMTKEGMAKKFHKKKTEKS